MTNIHIVNPEPLENEIVVEKNLRPSFFDEFVGQNKLVKNLKLFIKAANKRKHRKIS